MEYGFSFIPGDLDRAAHLRASSDLHQQPNATTFVFWRGTLLATADNTPLPVPLEHPALSDSREPPVFLGLTPEGARFAADLPLWTPPEDASTTGQFVDQSLQVHPAWPEAKFV